MWWGGGDFCCGGAKEVPGLECEGLWRGGELGGLEKLGARDVGAWWRLDYQGFLMIWRNG